MKKIIFLLYIAVILTSCSSTKKTDSGTRAGASIEKKKNLKFPTANAIEMAQDVAFLASDNLKGRDTGSEGIEKAAAYLSERFQELGIRSYKGSYRDNFVANGKKAFNVLAMIPGSDKALKDEVVVIGAHYDHIGMLQAVAGDSIANGANDNATGTATVLALATNFKELDFNRRTIVFALFSAEEKGLLGSKHLANRMKEEGVNVVAMLNFEMTGTPMVNRPYIAYLTGHDGSNMAAVFNDANKNRVVTGKLDQAAKFNLFKRSDNYPFFEMFHVPSQTFSTFDFTNFDHYHKVGDDTTKVNADHMAQLVNAVMPGVFSVVNGKKLKLTLATNE
ncbi:M20/M25/M40 family metallo-hydrolase [uncultured Nonlabens sp.]|uniref:M20/M25/M40 family metallo-hydrolase n=1 Tax=uncultured Nonlabens sp. TaxID=859306 RepID=UPI002629BE39|nr:M20/M25/M40 family metallo-hydrolase [uncultured Nonlabens sp.]